MEDGLDEAAQTAAEHAAAAAAEPAREARARPSRPAELEPDAPQGVCANCATALQGPVCHQCGQLADVYHRPVRGLIAELIEGLFALDGRVARTVPNLMGRPGRITRDYLKGRRARYMPPFRLYIIASLIFFLLIPGIDQVSDGFTDGANGFSDAINEASAAPGAVRTRLDADIRDSMAAGELTQAEAEEVRQALGRLGLALGAHREDAGAASATDAGQAGDSTAGDDPETNQNGVVSYSASRGGGEDTGLTIGPGGDPAQIRRFFAPEDYGEAAPDTMFPLSLRRFLGERFAQTAEDPGGWAEAAQDWVPRIMFAMVPVYALLLSLTYAWRRRFFFFDHLIVSMHFHSALFLAMAAGLLIGGGWAFAALLVYSNIYLYRLHRVVYGRGRFASMLRTLTLDVLYFIVLMFGLVAVLLLGALAG